MSGAEAGPVREGGCSCGRVRYRMTGDPIVVHACHCSYCQRETDGAFALNAVIEAENVTLTEGAPIEVLTPSASGEGQKIHRCPDCHVALWSNYAAAGDAIRFVRVGSLDGPERPVPDVHIYTSTKQPWLRLPEDARVYEGFYDPRTTWTPDGMARWKRARG